MFLRCSINDLVVKASQVPAMFVFGDSIVDTGNNNFLNSIAKANYYPYGCDSFSRFPTGQIVVTSLVSGEMLGIPAPPPFADPATTGDKLSGGVGYASAASGILDDSGRHYVILILGTFNKGLRSLTISLSRDHPGAVFVYGNIYGVAGDMINDAHKYGLSVVNRGCCGSGRNQGQITCMPFQPPGFNRKSYLFWDAYHTTEAANYTREPAVI